MSCLSVTIMLCPLPVLVRARDYGAEDRLACVASKHRGWRCDLSQQRFKTPNATESFGRTVSEPQSVEAVVVGQLCYRCSILECSWSGWLLILHLPVIRDEPFAWLPQDQQRRRHSQERAP
jgi:hypothetical protein